MLIYNIFKSKTAQVQNEESQDIPFSQTKTISP